MRLYGLQTLRNSFQSIILIRLHSVFFFGSAAASPTAFFPMRQYEHAPDRPFDVFPSATVSQIAFFVTCGFTDFNRSATPFKVLSLSACTLFFSSGRRLRHQLLFSLCGFADMPQTGLLRCSPRRMYHELLFLSHAALRTSTAPPLLSKYYPYPDCTLFFFGSAAASPTAFSLCGFTDMPQTGLLTCSPFKLLSVLFLRKKIRLQMQPYFQIYARYQIKDLYKAMISSLVGSFGLPGRQASSMAD